MAFDYDLLKDGDNFDICGCVAKIKRAGRFSYVYLAVCDDVVETLYKADFCSVPITDLCEGAFIKASVTVKNQPRSKYGKDIMLTDFSVLTKPHAVPPIPVYSSDIGLSFEDSMDNKIIAIRNPKIKMIYSAVSEAENAFSDHMRNKAFTLINTPVLVKDVYVNSFSLDYFNEAAALISSAQLYLAPCTAAFSRVYSVSRLFMNKRYNSTRHLNEYITLNAQIGYIDSLSDVIDFAKDCLLYIINRLKKKGILKNTPINCNTPVRITFPDALKLLNKSEQPDLDPTDIKKLCNHFADRSDIVMVTGFPKGNRDFYIDYDNGALECFDICLKGTKIGTGSKNITDYGKLTATGISEDNIYAQTVKYGIMPFGGFTLGLERLVMKLLGLLNIREASVFPRDIHHITP